MVGLDDMGADDEAFDGLALPGAGLGDVVRERTDLAKGLEDDGVGLEEPPLVGKGGDDGGGKGAKGTTGFVEAVEMETGFFWGTGEDVLLEVVVAELWRRW